MSTDVPPVDHPAWDRAQRAALAAALGGLAAFVVVGFVLYLAGGITSPVQFFLSYLVAYTFWLGAALGCMAILMLQHLTGGAWGIAIRRILESGAGTLVVLAVLFVPLVFGVHSLYLWAQHDFVEHSKLLQHKSPYLNVPFFVVRVIAYFAVWGLIAFLLNRWSTEQDRTGDPRLPRRFRLLSAPGLVLYGGTITFASVDWVMSLEPFWFSTIYPVLFATGQVLTGFAFAVTALVWLATQPPLHGVIERRHLRDVSNLMLAFVMLWAYMSISQFLLIWSGNLPEEITWYLRRTRGGWEWLAVLLILFQFALPFLLLLSRDVKDNARSLRLVALLVLVMRLIDVFWWIEPAYSHEGQYLFWLLDVAAVVGVGGVWVWWFVRLLRRRPLLPVHDPLPAGEGGHA